MADQPHRASANSYQRLLAIGFVIAVVSAVFFIIFVVREVDALPSLLAVPAGAIRAIQIREGALIAIGFAALYAVFAFTVYSFRDAIAEVQEERRSARFRAKVVDVIVHEITTPITALRWQIDFLQEKMKAGETDTPEVRQMIADAYGALERLNGLARKLIDIAHLEQEELLPRKGEDILPVILSVAEPYRAAADAKKISFSLELPQSLPRALVNHEFFSRALSELLENAVKFTDRGGIAVNAEETPEFVVITVADSGIGISHPERLFRPLQQIGREVREQRGVGAGLYLAKLAIEKQQGSILFRPNPGGGSAFFAMIPRETLAEPPRLPGA